MFVRFFRFFRFFRGFSVADLAAKQWPTWALCPGPLGPWPLAPGLLGPWANAPLSSEGFGPLGHQGLWALGPLGLQLGLYTPGPLDSEAFVILDPWVPRAPGPPGPLCP